MKVLIVGGTTVLGRRLVEAALAHGHDVPTFSRGRHHPGIHPHAEAMIGDRKGDLSALRGRHWDAAMEWQPLAR